MAKNNLKGTLSLGGKKGAINKTKKQNPIIKSRHIKQAPKRTGYYSGSGAPVQRQSDNPLERYIDRYLFSDEGRESGYSKTQLVDMVSKDPEGAKSLFIQAEEAKRYGTSELRKLGGEDSVVHLDNAYESIIGDTSLGMRTSPTDIIAGRMMNDNITGLHAFVAAAQEAEDMVKANLKPSSTSFEDRDVIARAAMSQGLDISSLVSTIKRSPAFKFGDIKSIPGAKNATQAMTVFRAMTGKDKGKQQVDESDVIAPNLYVEPINDPFIKDAVSVTDAFEAITDYYIDPIKLEQDAGFGEDEDLNNTRRRIRSYLEKELPHSVSGKAYDFALGGKGAWADALPSPDEVAEKIGESKFGDRYQPYLKTSTKMDNLQAAGVNTEGFIQAKDLKGSLQTIQKAFKASNQGGLKHTYDPERGSSRHIRDDLARGMDEGDTFGASVSDTTTEGEMTFESPLQLKFQELMEQFDIDTGFNTGRDDTSIDGNNKISEDDSRILRSLSKGRGRWYPKPEEFQENTVTNPKNPIPGSSSNSPKRKLNEQRREKVDKEWMNRPRPEGGVADRPTPSYLTTSLPLQETKDLKKPLRRPKNDFSDTAGTHERPSHTASWSDVEVPRVQTLPTNKEKIVQSKEANREKAGPDFWKQNENSKQPIQYGEPSKKNYEENRERQAAFYAANPHLQFIADDDDKEELGSKWQAGRLGRLGSSAVPSLTNSKAARGTLKDLYKGAFTPDKENAFKPNPNENNIHFSAGNALEEQAIGWYKDNVDDSIFEPGMMQDVNKKGQSTTPDAMTADGKRVVEFKSAQYLSDPYADATTQEGRNQRNQWQTYYAQLQHQMYISGAESGDIVQVAKDPLNPHLPDGGSFNSNNIQKRSYDRDEDFIERMKPMWDKFGENANTLAGLDSKVQKALTKAVADGSVEAYDTIAKKHGFDSDGSIRSALFGEDPREPRSRGGGGGGNYGGLGGSYMPTIGQAGRSVLSRSKAGRVANALYAIGKNAYDIADDANDTGLQIAAEARSAGFGNETQHRLNRASVQTERYATRQDALSDVRSFNLASGGLKAGFTDRAVNLVTSTRGAITFEDISTLDTSNPEAVSSLIEQTEGKLKQMGYDDSSIGAMMEQTGLKTLLTSDSDTLEGRKELNAGLVAIKETAIQANLSLQGTIGAAAKEVVTAIGIGTSTLDAIYNFLSGDFEGARERNDERGERSVVKQWIDKASSLFNPSEESSSKSDISSPEDVLNSGVDAVKSMGSSVKSLFEVDPREIDFEADIRSIPLNHQHVRRKIERVAEQYDTTPENIVRGMATYTKEESSGQEESDSFLIGDLFSDQNTEDMQEYLSNNPERLALAEAGLEAAYGINSASNPTALAEINKELSALATALKGQKIAFTIELLEGGGFAVSGIDQDGNVVKTTKVGE